ncbi:hypothetical protein E6P97_02895 [Patescibacteria group bacterium]|nr:MAG: hypothetical protein E6P97_02895 [Patescibacteria group bacterium]
MDQQQINDIPNMAAVAAEQVPSGDIQPQGSWPGAFRVFKYSKEVVTQNWTTILVLIAVLFFGSIVITSVFPDKIVAVEGASLPVTVPNPIAELVYGVLSTVVSIATLATMFAGARREKMSLVQSFRQVSIARFFRYIITSFIVAFITMASFFAFIIPFFFVAPRLALYAQFIVDKDMGVLESIQASWRATKGNVGKLYGILGVYMLFSILIFVLVGFYLLFMYSASLVLLYNYIQKNQVDTSASTSAPAAAV